MTCLVFTSYISAQDTTASTAQLPPGSVRLKAGSPDNADARLLAAVYRTIQYPQSAWAYGITGAVFVTYTIDTSGILTVDNTRYFSPEEFAARPMRIREADIFRITAFTVGGPAYSGSATTSAKRLKRGRANLCKEVARTLRALPTFVPARRGGEIIAETQIKLFYFDME
ncbi:hypothetical protein [Lewinella sp. IMCC34191]|uniref:hypothetical protein n=1 Tax=Lewinella sp. IMCC34191 TaxID=2259172 RepID=UPI000E21EA24|nr:hypothetical protein [Lewinella sp. IMCC34191]